MPMDLYRDGDHYVLAADLPGIDPGSVDIDVDGQLLTIRAERTLRSTGREMAGPRAAERLVPRPAERRAGGGHVTIQVSERAKPRRIAVSTTGAPEQVGSTNGTAQPEQSAISD